ncbi:hypothetical protein ACFU8W_25065 [Streptomyces sp. NPDC057565]|uniref:hypothetical protein n=1 Tax=Streptomyces sp. NPDC057565 TaxID=3346169 RepID=UPI0036B62182
MDEHPDLQDEHAPREPNRRAVLGAGAAAAIAAAYGATQLLGAQEAVAVRGGRYGDWSGQGRSEVLARNGAVATSSR